MGESSNNKPLIGELEIRHRTTHLAMAIAEDFSAGDMVMLVVLKGGFVFAADLLRRLHGFGLSPQVEFLRASSYGDKVHSSGSVEISVDTTDSLDGKNVLIVDDIIDTGYTLKEMHRYVSEKKPLSIRSCVLLDKPSRRMVDFSADYVGFEIPDMFVVGYGLDYGQDYRYLPYITIAEDAGEKKAK